MKATALFSVLLSLCAVAFAEDVTLKIPDQGWAISFDSPLLSQGQEARRDAGPAGGGT